MTESEGGQRWFCFMRGICRNFCRLFFRLHIYGLQNVPEEGPLILISNHQSYLDPVFCGIYLKRPLYFLARHNLFERRFFGRLISSVNAIPVRRGEADLGAIKEVIGRLKKGFGLCLFPEGTRSRDGRIAAFKSGFGLLCRRGKAAIVPVMIDGAFECWPRHKKIFSPWRKIIIRYGECISPEEAGAMSDKELAEYLTARVRQMQNECRARQGKKKYDY